MRESNTIHVDRNKNGKLHGAYAYNNNYYCYRDLSVRHIGAFGIRQKSSGSQCHSVLAICRRTNANGINASRVSDGVHTDIISRRYCRPFPTDQKPCAKTAYSVLANETLATCNRFTLALIPPGQLTTLRTSPSQARSQKISIKWPIILCIVFHNLLTTDLI